jgi:hypothetical protein
VTLLGLSWDWLYLHCYHGLRRHDFSVVEERDNSNGVRERDNTAPYNCPGVTNIILALSRDDRKYTIPVITVWTSLAA